MCKCKYKGPVLEAEKYFGGWREGSVGTLHRGGGFSFSQIHYQRYEFGGLGVGVSLELPPMLMPLQRTYSGIQEALTSCHTAYCTAFCCERFYITSAVDVLMRFLKISLTDTLGTKLRSNFLCTSHIFFVPFVMHNKG